MDKSLCFKIANQKIAHESFEDELILVNFDTGAYYSTGKAGSYIWSLINRNVPVAFMIKKICARYEANCDEVEKSLDVFLTELQKEGLIVSETANRGSDMEGAGEEAKTERTTEKFGFEAPILQKYTDIQELLLLDPIHGVNELGWPYKKSDTVPDSQNT
jgi:hypothetical protein